MTELTFNECARWLEDRDRFVLSKGHTVPALYGILALKGFFPEEDVKTLYAIGAHIIGTPNPEAVENVIKKLDKEADK